MRAKIKASLYSQHVSRKELEGEAEKTYKKTSTVVEKEALEASLTHGNTDRTDPNKFRHGMQQQEYHLHGMTPVHIVHNSQSPSQYPAPSQQHQTNMMMQRQPPTIITTAKSPTTTTIPNQKLKNHLDHIRNIISSFSWNGNGYWVI